MDRQILRAELVRDEGLRLMPYRDSLGYLTIGVGRCIEKRGISDAEAMHLLDNDIAIAEADLDRNVSWWREMSDVRQRALLNMAFNLGWPTLARFRKMLAALEAGDYSRAANEALDSRWAKQVGRRADRIANMIKKG